MILGRIRDYLRERGQANLLDLALHFDTTPDAMRGMLEPWLRKGRVRRVAMDAACGSGCSQCVPEVTEVYVWAEGVGDDAPAALPIRPSCGRQ